MVQNLSIQMQVVKLQAGIKYAEEDLPNAKVHIQYMYITCMCMYCIAIHMYLYVKTIMWRVFHNCVDSGGTVCY